MRHHWLTRIDLQHFTQISYGQGIDVDVPNAIEESQRLGVVQNQVVVTARTPGQYHVDISRADQHLPNMHAQDSVYRLENFAKQLTS